MQPSFQYLFLAPTSLTDMHNQTPATIFKRFGNSCRDYFQFEQCHKYTTAAQNAKKVSTEDDDYVFIEAVRRKVQAPQRRKWRYLQ
ncbi:hypothetical protein SS50377_20466 [Spironucleus salmonicida]|uniref:Uncharacterized protein n=1 Tax=Spironucleus salmonicida TaxID=348837 RepID=A0A9P8S1V6_9EUKA|nr:hypothetical protein SS50377_20466 [Spironucleus salmonicida]